MQGKLRRLDLKVLLKKLSIDNSKSTRYRAASEINRRVGQNRIREPKRLVNSILRSILFENNNKIRSESIEVLQILYDDYLDLISNAISRNKDKLDYPEVLKEWVQSDYDIIKLVGLNCINKQCNSQIIENELMRLINHPNSEIQKNVIHQCGQIGYNKYTSNIERTLSSDNLDVIETSVDSLVKINSKEAFQALLPYAHDKKHPKYKYILKNIGKFGCFDSFGSIMYGYNQDEPEIKKASIYSSIYLITNGGNSHYKRQTVSNHFDRDAVKFLLAIIDSKNRRIMRNAVWLTSELISEVKNDYLIKKFVSCIDCSDSATRNIIKFNLSKSSHSDRIIRHLENYIKNNNLDSETLKCADYIRNKINKNEIEDHKRNRVKYKSISKPEEYTKMKRKEGSEE